MALYRRECSPFVQWSGDDGEGEDVGDAGVLISHLTQLVEAEMEAAAELRSRCGGLGVRHQICSAMDTLARLCRQRWVRAAMPPSPPHSASLCARSPWSARVQYQRDKRFACRSQLQRITVCSAPALAAQSVFYRIRRVQALVCPALTPGLQNAWRSTARHKEIETTHAAGWCGARGRQRCTAVGLAGGRHGWQPNPVWCSPPNQASQTSSADAMRSGRARLG